jgi:TPP-dependent pyruvate/acetoin dehydrogenase alpha subunit
VTEVWKSKKDPLRRMRTLLEHRGWLAPGESDELAASLETRVRDTITAQERIGPPPTSSLFEDVFEEPTWLLDEQARTL